MVFIKPLLPTTKQLTSLFSSPSALLSSASPSTSTSPQIQSEKQQDSTARAAESSICKGIRRRKGVATVSVLFLVLLDLLGVVPIIILITTTSSPTSVSAVSIAAVSIASNVYADGKGNGGSGNFDNQQQQHHHQPGRSPQPQKLSFLTGNDAKGKGNGSAVGVLNLSFGELSFAKKLQQQKKETAGKSIRNRVIVKRNVGDTRITSNQDVTTLALAVDNSSSVAIANINSSFNTVHVSIGSNAFPSRFDPGNRFDPYSGGDDDDKY